MTFKTTHSLTDRIKESSRIMEKYPDKIPVICERNSNSTLPTMDKTKFLVPTDLTIGQFIYVIRKRIKITPREAIYLFIKGHMPPSNETMDITYNKFRDEDGFLYISYANENTFGGGFPQIPFMPEYPKLSEEEEELLNVICVFSVSALIVLFRWSV